MEGRPTCGPLEEAQLGRRGQAHAVRKLASWQLHGRAGSAGQGRWVHVEASRLKRGWSRSAGSTLQPPSSKRRQLPNMHRQPRCPAAASNLYTLPPHVLLPPPAWMLTHPQARMPPSSAHLCDVKHLAVGLQEDGAQVGHQRTLRNLLQAQGGAAGDVAGGGELAREEGQGTVGPLVRPARGDARVTHRREGCQGWLPQGKPAPQRASSCCFLCTGGAAPAGSTCSAACPAGQRLGRATQRSRGAWRPSGHVLQAAQPC